jgi:hypothetical protein
MENVLDVLRAFLKARLSLSLFHALQLSVAAMA